MSEIVVQGQSYQHVHVVVDGQDSYHSFKHVAVSRHINALGSHFQILFPNRWIDLRAEFKLGLGRRIQVNLIDQTILEGHVEKLNSEVTAGNHIIQVSGRDRTGDLIDCSPNEFPEFNKLTLKQIAEKVCAPFRIAVTDQAKDNYVFEKAKFKPGETVFNFLNRLSKQRGLLLNSVPGKGGGLALVRPASITYQNEKLDWRNILECSAAIDTSKVFSSYTVLSQTNKVINIDGDEGEINQETHVNATIRDRSVRREIAPGQFIERPKTIIAEKQSTNTEAESRAKWEHATRLAAMLQAKITVNGWLNREGELWRENRIVPVVYPQVGLNGNYLITSVRYVYGYNESIKTELTLAHKDAYNRRVQAAEPKTAARIVITDEQAAEIRKANQATNISKDRPTKDIPTNQGTP